MINKKQESAIFTALGEASVSWSPRPKGTFNTTQAIEIGERLIKKLNQLEK